MRQLNAILIEFVSSMVSFSRITEIFFKPSETYEIDKRPCTTGIRGEIVFNNVYFSYNSKINTLKGINFKCEPDTVVALIGTTGSGKTSLINLLPRFYDYTQGSLQLDGIELKEYPLEFLRSNIGIVEQEPFLFSCTVAENIALGIQGNDIDSKIISAAKASYIYDEIVALPNGFNTIVGENGITLSGGQRQRIAIARALLNDPKILILDDAMSSVDLENEEKIGMAMQNVMRNRTTFVIAHRIKSILLANTIVVLNDGTIEEIGSHSDLIKKNGTYAKMYNLQATLHEDVHMEISNAESKS
jgi:ATP-binding cassette subfamily B protein